MDELIKFRVDDVTIEFGKALAKEWMIEWQGIYDDSCFTMAQHAGHIWEIYNKGGFIHDELVEGYGISRQLDRSLWLLEIWNSDSSLESYAIVTGGY